MRQERIIFRLAPITCTTDCPIQRPHLLYFTASSHHNPALHSVKRHTALDKNCEAKNWQKADSLSNRQNYAVSTSTSLACNGFNIHRISVFYTVLRTDTQREKQTFLTDG